jgi:polysaccharide chain length determinant protein (PEP-CTERM system associated)
MERVEIEKYKDMAMRRIWWIIIPLLLSILIGLGLYLKLPKIYRASTLILIQAQKVPQEYVREIVTSDIEDRVRTITQQVTSRTNLENIIREFNLYNEPGGPVFMEAKVEGLRRRITVDVSGGGRRGANAFQISFIGSYPKQVADVTNALASYFIAENLKLREDQAMGTAEFLSEELESIRRRLVEKEAELKRYRESYMGGLPEQLDTNLRILERLQDQLVTNQENLREAQNRKLLVQQQLADAVKTRRSLTPPPQPTRPGQEPEESLEQLKTLLTSLEARYTQRHPDVVRLKKKIADLESNENNVPEKAEDIPEDTAFMQAERNMVSQLREIELQIQNLKAEALQLNSQIKQYEALVEKTPKREQELMSLNRDYDNIRETYNSLLSRKLEAELAVSMERKQKGEQFRILDPAKTPMQPFKPDMRRIFLMSIALGFAVGCGLAYVREMMDTSFRKPDEIEDFLHVPVIASLPFAYSARELRSMKRKKVLGVIAMGLSFIILAVLIVVSAKGVEGTLELIKKTAESFLGV